MKLSLTKDLAPLRLAASLEIDRAAEDKRLEHLTPGAGQQLEYRATLDEALAFQDDPAPADASYPMLAAERDAQIESGANPAASLSSVAGEVLAQAAAWTAPTGAAIKKARRLGKLRVQTATTPAGIDAARDQALSDFNAI